MFGTSPNEFLASRISLFPSPSVNSQQTPHILCVGDGEGRNGVYLCSLGYRVTSVDISQVGLTKAQQLCASVCPPASSLLFQTVCADLTEWTPPEEDTYDAVVVIFCHLSSAARRIAEAKWVHSLRPTTGLFLLEAYTPAQIPRGTGGPKDLDLLMTQEEIEKWLVEKDGLEVVELQETERMCVEGVLHTGMASVVQFVGRKK